MCRRFILVPQSVDRARKRFGIRGRTRARQKAIQSGLKGWSFHNPGQSETDSSSVALGIENNRNFVSALKGHVNHPILRI